MDRPEPCGAGVSLEPRGLFYPLNKELPPRPCCVAYASDLYKEGIEGWAISLTVEDVDAKPTSTVCPGSEWRTSGSGSLAPAKDGTAANGGYCGWLALDEETSDSCKEPGITGHERQNLGSSTIEQVFESGDAVRVHLRPMVEFFTAERQMPLP